MQGQTRAGGENCAIGIACESGTARLKKEAMNSSDLVDRFSPQSGQSPRKDCSFVGDLDEIGIDLGGGSVLGTDFTSQAVGIGNLY